MSTAPQKCRWNLSGSACGWGVSAGDVGADVCGLEDVVSAGGLVPRPAARAAASAAMAAATDCCDFVEGFIFSILVVDAEKACNKVGHSSVFVKSEKKKTHTRHTTETPQVSLFAGSAV